MTKLIPYKGILQQIKDNPPKEVNTSLTEDDFVKWIQALGDKTIDKKPTTIIGAAALKDFHDKNGIEKLKALLNNCSVLTSEDGINYLKSIGL